MTTPEATAKILESEVNVVKGYLAALSEFDLQKPSACENWSVADVMAHLAGQDHALVIRKGLEGDYSPPEGAPAVANHNEDEFAQRIFNRALATKEQHGGSLTAYLIQRLEEVVEVFNSVGPQDWEKLCYWPPGPEQVQTLLSQRVAELTMHTWDIRSVLDDQYHLSDNAVSVLIDGVDRAVRRAFRPDPSINTPITHRFVIEGSSATKKDIVIGFAGAQIGSASSEEPDVTFECDGESYVLIMYGRLKIADALAHGQLYFDGNPALAVGFGRRFVGG